MDAVDHFVAQWAHVKPDLDVSPMHVIGRLSRLSALVQQQMDEVFSAHGLQSWEFDVLATLTRAGEPFALTAGDLDRSMMITSGTTTHRITRLEQRGLVSRTRDEDDRRVVRVRLTPEGRAVFDAAHDAHVANQHRLLSVMGAESRDALGRALRAMAEALGDRPPLLRDQR